MKAMCPSFCCKETGRQQEVVLPQPTILGKILLRFLCLKVFQYGIYVENWALWLPTALYTVLINRYPSDLTLVHLKRCSIHTGLESSVTRVVSRYKGGLNDITLIWGTPRRPRVCSITCERRSFPPQHSQMQCHMYVYIINVYIHIYKDMLCSFLENIF